VFLVNYQLIPAEQLRWREVYDAIADSVPGYDRACLVIPARDSTPRIFVVNLTDASETALERALDELLVTIRAVSRIYVSLASLAFSAIAVRPDAAVWPVSVLISLFAY
jgi:hypothetical protein